MRRTLSSGIVLVYPRATHGPDVVCAVKAAAARATPLAFTRGKKDVGNGKLGGGGLPVSPTKSADVSWSVIDKAALWT